MGQQIGFFGPIALGDNFHTVSPKLERMAAAAVPVFGASQAELPEDSSNWRKTLEAVFDKDESGSGPAGQWLLHEWLDTVEAQIYAIGTAAIGWIGDKLKTSPVTVGAATGASRILTVTDLADMLVVVGDVVYSSSGGWGVVDFVGSGPPHTVRVTELFDFAVDPGHDLYRAWRVYPTCRPLAFDPGVPEAGAMDGFRHGIKLRTDTKGAAVKSTGP